MTLSSPLAVVGQGGSATNNAPLISAIGVGGWATQTQVESQTTTTCFFQPFPSEHTPDFAKCRFTHHT